MFSFQVQLDKLQFEISQAARRTGIQKASKLALLAPQAEENDEDDDVDDDSLDWWDSYVFKPDMLVKLIINKLFLFSCS